MAHSKLEEADSCWDFIDCSFFGDDASYFPHTPSFDVELNFSTTTTTTTAETTTTTAAATTTSGSVATKNDQIERHCTGKRGRTDASGGSRTKACREKLRREKLNERFLDLSSILEPGRSVKTEKPAILDDAIRVITQLQAESQELKESNEKLLEEIKSLKAEKNELREEKITLKAEKERMEQQLKTCHPPVSIPPAGFVPSHPQAYYAMPNKMAMFPSYGLCPMWQYLPPSVCDTSSDYELRPPAA